MTLLLLLAVLALAGAFAAENGGTGVFHLLDASATLPVWAPTAAAVGAGSVLVVLGVSAAGLRSRLREIGHRQRIDRQLGVIEELEADNARLREELAAATGRALADQGAAVPCWAGQGWPPPPTPPGPRSVTSSPPIGPPPA